MTLTVLVDGKLLISEKFPISAWAFDISQFWLSDEATSD